MKISVVLATRNEEENIARCLESVKKFAEEIIVLDEGSTDKTQEIAKKFGAKVFNVKHEPIFHITKQKAIDKASGDWILQLDADEVVSVELKEEIISVLNMSDHEILARKSTDSHKQKLFSRHLKAIEARDGVLGKKTGEVVAFFIPRINMFLGKPLIYGGVYPDGVIRLIKRGKARLPGVSVHEQMVIDGEISWLFGPLMHYDSPTLFRYIERLNRYTDLRAAELKKANTSRSFMRLLMATTLEPLNAFVRIYVRHRGYKDGVRGFLWATFSSWHYPISYFKFYLGQT